MVDSLKGLPVNCIKTAKRDIDTCLSEEQKVMIYDNPNSFGRTYYEHRKALELSKEDFIELKNYVEAAGFDFISSFTDKPSLEFLSKIQATFKEVEYDWLLLGNPQPKEQAPTTLFENTDLKPEEKITEPIMTLNKNSEHTAPIKEIIYVYEDDSFKVIQRKS